MSAERSRHVPLRRCAVCRGSLPQSRLIRFARSETGAWRVDRDRREGGRGMWVCTETRCHERKALGRAFRAQAADIAEQLAAIDEAGRRRSADDETGASAERQHPARKRAAHEQEIKKASQDGGLDV